MKVYLTYFRYDRGECYSIYNIETNLKRSLKSWKEKDLPNFLGYGPDDVSQLYLVKCDLTKSEVQLIKDFMESDKDYDKDFYDLMSTKVHDCYEEICCTSGDEVWEVVDFVCEYCRTTVLFTEFLPYHSTLNFDDEDELREQIQEIIFDNDDKMWETVLKKYIDWYY
jgi:hypothetical protein